MTIIPLNRRFHRWTEDNSFDAEAIRMLRNGGFSLDWATLLKAKRVVILAEGGSGKSTEFTAQHDQLIKQGAFSFLATVTRVGDRGVESALSYQDRQRLVEWRKSGKPAWFFVDSVDEAKRASVRFEDALRHIADSILGAEGRAHVVVSGRHSDWEFNRDLAALADILPIHDLTALPAAAPNELVIQALHRKKSDKAPIEMPLVMLMDPLDAAQVERFAVGKGISNAQDFLSEIDYSRLWTFASRPVDLDWLVRFWLNKCSFDNLERMLDLSLSARLKETDRIRAGQIALDANLAMSSLERVGAALIFGRRESILIPDSERSLADDINAISLGDVLPDLTSQQHLELLNSAVFVPSDSGLARIHNDNEGVVRSYLTARWLQKLSDKNCPWSRLSELLFATTYGVKVVKPSMRQTAAWLSIWNPAVAQQVLERDPMLLAQAGDPASLPAHVRAQALSAAIQTSAARPHVGFLDHEALRRFARPDIEDTVKALWAQWKDNEAIRQLLLMMIEAGELTGCADIAFDTATNLAIDSLSQSLAARALATSGSPAQLAVYRSFLLSNRSRIERDTLWVAVDELFPTSLSVEDIILLMDDLTRDGDNHASGLDFYGPKLAERLDKASQALELLRHLMDKWLVDPEDASPADFERFDARVNTMRALAVRILDLTEAVPPLEIFDLQLGLDHLERYHPFTNFSKVDLGARLAATPLLRREWLWRAVAKYAAWPKAVVQPLPSIWPLSHLAYRPNFDETDTPWLLADIADRPPTGSSVALSALLWVWNSTGQREELFHEIGKVAQATPELAEIFDQWTRPREQSQAEKGFEQENRVRGVEMQRQREATERSWTDYADGIRRDPQQLAALIVPSEEGVDQRMLFLWTILRGRSEDVSHGTAPDLGAMKGMFHDDVIGLFQKALVSHWKLAPMPRLKSELPVADRDTFNTTEFMGLDGVSLEALSTPRWAERLIGDEAIKAAIYATFALNKLPHWLPDLCKAHPSTCADILWRHLAPDLHDKAAIGRRNTLERLADSDNSVVSLLEAGVWNLVEKNPTLTLDVLSPALKILQRAATDRSRLFDLAVARADASAEPRLIATYLAVAFSIDSQAAAARMAQRTRSMEDDNSRAFARVLIPKIFGNSWSPGPTPALALSTQVMESLILFAFDRIPPSDDPNRANGKVYSPGEMDFASRARELAFNRLADTPGGATFAALNRLIAQPEFSPSKWHLAELAHKRAATDSESAPWRPSHLLEFELHFKAVPRTPQDLQRLAANRLADLQHDLINADFQQARTVAILENERQVQLWFADRFKLDQSSSFAIDRESMVADEKAPDLRLRAKASQASLPIEIKVAESWSLHQLEEALTVQLQGRYLRDRNDRWGILLLVYQKQRPQGWDGPNGEIWAFSDVVRHLMKLANDIADSDSLTPQMLVCVIDVSSATPPKPAKTKKPRKKRHCQRQNKPCA
ncbi:hypothetical protein ASC94_11190 [Massilia sp. Root418]|uniref:hypothetical protein n=1 Tax=Massilia sp. Root418 TaxID=1736532 RepID=UPI0007014CB3|nr:hypothetical protein [Massilia sp. Root418]KQW93232.1 hypothetical protein ASC94_11190 [Massilia sp. Root418]